MDSILLRTVRQSRHSMYDFTPGAWLSNNLVSEVGQFQGTLNGCDTEPQEQTGGCLRTVVPVLRPGWYARCTDVHVVGD